MSDDIDQIANDIVSQLKNGVPTESQPRSDVKPEQLEQFLIDKASEVIDNTNEVINNLKNYINTGSDPKEIMGFAEVVKASSAAIESLNKIYISRERSKSARAIKQMDLDARKEMIKDINDTRLLISREELLKQLIKKTEDVIEAEIVGNKAIEDSPQITD